MDNVAHVRAWRRANPEKKRAADERRRRNNPEAVRACQKRWRLNHPDRKRADCALRRARILTVTLGDVNVIKQFYEWLHKTGIVICHWCREVVPLDLRRADHYIPLAKGGEHSLENLVPACNRCNSSKGSKLPEEFCLTV